MKSLDQYPISELKLIYRILHARLPQDPELMDSELLQELQTLLQRRAKHHGVDVSHHAQWSSWLNDAPALRGPQ